MATCLFIRIHESVELRKYPSHESVKVMLQVGPYSSQSFTWTDKRTPRWQQLFSFFLTERVVSASARVYINRKLVTQIPIRLDILQPYKEHDEWYRLDGLSLDLALRLSLLKRPLTLASDVEERIDRDVFGFAIYPEKNVIAHEKQMVGMKFRMTEDVHWDDFLASAKVKSAASVKPTFPGEHSFKVRDACRNGIALAHRGQAWFMLSGARALQQESPALYRTLLETRGIDESPWYRAIDVDLRRTFPSHAVYRHTEGIEMLRRVLLAYSLKNTEVGYCQGMNFIAAMLLLFMGEEEAFWMMVVIVETICKNYYSANMMGTLVDQRIFEELVRTHSPRVLNKIQRMGINVEIISMHWFLCIFVDVVPTETTLRIWDAFFAEGPPVLFVIAAAIIKQHEEAMLKHDSLETMCDVLKCEMRDLYRSSDLLQQAFETIGFIGQNNVLDQRSHFETMLAKDKSARIVGPDRARASKGGFSVGIFSRLTEMGERIKDQANIFVDKGQQLVKMGGPDGSSNDEADADADPRLLDDSLADLHYRFSPIVAVTMSSDLLAHRALQAEPPTRGGDAEPPRARVSRQRLSQLCAQYPHQHLPADWAMQIDEQSDDEASTMSDDYLRGERVVATEPLDQSRENKSEVVNAVQQFGNQFKNEMKGFGSGLRSLLSGPTPARARAEPNPWMDAPSAASDDPSPMATPTADDPTDASHRSVDEGPHFVSESGTGSDDTAYSPLQEVPPSPPKHRSISLTSSPIAQSTEAESTANGVNPAAEESLAATTNAA